MSGSYKLRPGKLPNEALAQMLARLGRRDPRVVVGPGVGRDAAVIDTGAPKLLVAKTDPITFATDFIGWYAVHVNANDIACMGAQPSWFLATVLLPDGAPLELPETIFAQLDEACAALGIELIGGHTEVTLGLERPIVVGAMLGELERDRLVRPERARPGDAVILTKGIAIEGTAVLAREAAGRLRALGVSDRDLERAAAYLHEPGISIVAEARAACEAADVHAMHDPTEGGLATALYELAEACGKGIRVEAETIEVMPETRIICRAAALDPLGLLASGSLLLVTGDGEAQTAIEAIERTGVPARRIGSLIESRDGVIMVGNGNLQAAPRFPRDEVARFLIDTPARKETGIRRGKTSGGGR